MHRFQLLAASTLAISMTAGAQAPAYRLQPAAKLGGSLDSLVLGKPGQPFLTFWDTAAGPTRVLGQTVWLGLTPALTLLDAGLLDGIGARSLRIRTPPTPSLAGMAFFGQALLLDAKSRNGLFETSNGASTILHRAKHVLVSEFRDPVAEGFTGTWNRSVKHRIMGRAPRGRLVRPVERAKGWRFGFGVPAPLNAHGTRIQMVFRAIDLGGTAEEEVVTAIHWRPFAGKVTPDAFPRVVIDISHSHVVPDYRVNPVTALPLFPNSGLDRTFLRNVFPAQKQTRLYDGPYAFQLRDLRKDGYLPYPAPQKQFARNGRDSLLLDFKVVPSAQAKGTNGQEVWLQVASSPRPNSRVVSNGTRSAPVDPFRIAAANTGDNAIHDYQFELTKVKSTATSPWIWSGSPSPDYSPAHIAAATPPGTRILLEYAGARDAKGGRQTGFTTRIDTIDRWPFIRYRIFLYANPTTGATPSVDTLVIPVN